MSELTAIHEIYRRFCSGNKPFAKMVTIYIEESSDGYGWNHVKPIRDHHRNIEERVTAANRLINETGWKAGEIICDSMKNQALERYEAFPERLLIVQDGIVVHDGGKGPIFGVRYNPTDVMKWLKDADTRAESDIPPETESEQAEVQEEKPEDCAA